MTVGSCRKQFKQSQPKLFYIKFSKSFQTAVLYHFISPENFLHYLCTMITTEFFNCIFFCAVFFILCFSNDLFIYLLFLKVLFSSQLKSHNSSDPAFPSQHLMDCRSYQHKVNNEMCFFLVMYNLWNVSLLNCTRGYYVGRFYLHIKHVPLLRDVKGQMMCHRFFLVSLPVVTKIENLIKKETTLKESQKEGLISEGAHVGTLNGSQSFSKGKWNSGHRWSHLNQLMTQPGAFSPHKQNVQSTVRIRHKLETLSILAL